VDSAPSPDAIPEVVPVPSATTVRLIGEGLQAAKFKTRCSIREILDGVDEMLYSLGLVFDKSGVVSGSLRHPQSWVCAIAVDGTARERAEKAEFVIDLSWRSSMTTAAILIAIFLFPLGLVLAVVFSQMAQNDVKRLVDDAFRSLRHNLEEV
jgi:hypothetical protein